MSLQIVTASVPALLVLGIGDYSGKEAIAQLINCCSWTARPFLVLLRYLQAWAREVTIRRLQESAKGQV